MVEKVDGKAPAKTIVDLIAVLFGFVCLCYLTWYVLTRTKDKEKEEQEVPRSLRLQTQSSRHASTSDQSMPPIGDESPASPNSPSSRSLSMQKQETDEEDNVITKFALNARYLLLGSLGASTLLNFVHSIAGIVLLAGGNFPCEIRLCAGLLIGIQRLIIYEFYLARITHTFRGSIFRVSPKVRNVVAIILFVVWSAICINTASTIFDPKYKEDKKKECFFKGYDDTFFLLVGFDFICNVSSVGYFVWKMRKLQGYLLPGKIQSDNIAADEEVKFTSYLRNFTKKLMILLVLTTLTTWFCITVGTQFALDIFAAGVDAVFNNLFMVMSFEFGSWMYDYMCCKKN